MTAIKEITPTVFLKEEAGCLKQLVRIVLVSEVQRESLALHISYQDIDATILLEHIPIGESGHEFFLDEIKVPTTVAFRLSLDGEICDSKEMEWQPPKHWKVHVVQLSHHDVGYTNLPSTVIQQHVAYLDHAIDMAEQTDDYPDDAKFRIVIEQMWSLDHFLKSAPADRIEKIIRPIRAGRFEVTALFGNMITELCGHEELIRTLYPAAAFARKYDIPIVSAENNDITGMSWGLCRALVDAGVKIFCPGLPLYYSWGTLELQSFWDQDTLFPYGGPGAFWWEAPTGKRLLLWCNNSGCGGGHDGRMPDLADKLQQLGADYPFSVMRWPVQGALRDNSPYIIDYADTIKSWNETWAFPHLVSSTNAMFYADFVQEDLSKLPVFRGELSGQDFAPGALSTAAATTQSRNNHAGATSAEMLSVLADGEMDAQDMLKSAYEEMLWADEHTWGFYIPCGPSIRASEYEKAVHTYKAAALINETSLNALAKLSDRIKTEEDGTYLVVYNMTARPKTGPVRVSLRELDSSNTLYKDAQGCLQGAPLYDGRAHVDPSQEIVDGFFTLTDVQASQPVDCQIIPIASYLTPVPYAAERQGIGEGKRRLGQQELYTGMGRDLCFVATIPPYGYKVFRFDKAETPNAFQDACPQDNMIENEYYRIAVKDGGIASIVDKTNGSELIDADCRFDFGSLIVRTPLNDREFTIERTHTKVERGTVRSVIEVTGEAYGHPRVRYAISLYNGVKQISLDVKLLKDATPLLNSHIAFPFRMKNPHFRYEGTLSIMNPIEDFLPGSYSDRITVQNWVKVSNGAYSILWASIDSPVVSLSQLSDGYISPAHRCVIDESAAHPPMTQDGLNTGWIFSNITENNFCTNFSVSQTGDLLFRYVITTQDGEVSDSDAVNFGMQAATPFDFAYTHGSKTGSLANVHRFMELDNDNVVVLTLKKAEDTRGLILRLWNVSKREESVNIQFKAGDIAGAWRTDLLENNLSEIPCFGNVISLTMPANDVCTLRLGTDRQEAR